MALSLVPEPPVELPLPNGDGVVLDDGSVSLRLVALEVRRVRDALATTRCEIAFASSTRLVTLEGSLAQLERDDLATNEVGRRIVKLRARAGTIRLFTCTETCGSITLAVRRSASVLLGDGTWLPATVPNSVGPYLVVRWDGGLVMLT